MLARRPKLRRRHEHAAAAVCSRTRTRPRHSRTQPHPTRTRTSTHRPDRTAQRYQSAERQRAHEARHHRKGISSTGSNNSSTRSLWTRPLPRLARSTARHWSGRPKSGAEPSVLSRNTAPRTTLLTRANRSASVRPNRQADGLGTSRRHLRVQCRPTRQPERFRPIRPTTRPRR